jgi:hypothetical protein
MYKCQRYTVAASVLCAEGTREASLQAANEWWTKRRAEIDLAADKDAPMRAALHELLQKDAAGRLWSEDNMAKLARLGAALYGPETVAGLALPQRRGEDVSVEAVVQRFLAGLDGAKSSLTTYRSHLDVMMEAIGEPKSPQDAPESTLTARRLGGPTHLYLQNAPEATVDAGKGICQEGQTDRLILVPHRTLWERHSPCQPAMRGQHFEPSRPRLALRRPGVEPPGKRFFGHRILGMHSAKIFQPLLFPLGLPL